MAKLPERWGNNLANIRRANGGGSFTDLRPSATGWALAQNFNGGLQVCVLCSDLRSPKPPAHRETRTIWILRFGESLYLRQPPPQSLHGRNCHLFLVNMAGVTSNSTITSATFFFNTTDGVSVGTRTARAA
jgi:hypothetical protein